ncbi:hypothetical protein GGF44_002408, partial [Coemansia sp. RSA 1694]
MQTPPGHAGSHRSPSHRSPRGPARRSPAHPAHAPGRTTREAAAANGCVCWATMRRDRQARVDAVLDAHAANVAAGLGSPGQQQQQRAGHLGGAGAHDVAKAVRSRAREVGWMLGTRNKPKTTRLTGLAHALRSTAYDEDDVISDALAQAAAGALGALEQVGAGAGAGAAAEFEAVQEIAALRSLMRALVRLQAEHADADVRRSTGELLARLSGGEKKALRMPVPRAVASGPSFFFPAHAFARRAGGGHAHAGGGAGDACDAGDSSSDDDDGDGDDGGDS